MGTMHRCTRVMICTALLAACAKTDKTATDSAAGAVDSSAMAAPAPTVIALADVAGKWNIVAVPVGGTDTTKTTYVLTATADTTGWTITFPGRKPMAISVQASGDSIITFAGPYDSVRRKGLKVTTDGVFRLQDGKLVGNTTAHFKTTKADSTLVLSSEGTRAP